ncbi:M4 family metallopeptidase [Dyadobacter sp. MSC1_007]|jgi:hypothetical protein|uniref:M4 family metallopeptidase n=1 Tax=Dyadobacter sp. MSC1_007 TaxID=2909264 RepID=UPI00202E4BDD|nr:M4 family metallopeptidase [Dyadobacter sp. MSC1_007]
MKKNLRLLICYCVLFLLEHTGGKCQQIYNEHNVTQDVLTDHYDPIVPVRVMEYSTDPQGTILERRLESLPENGFPSVKVRIINDQFEEIHFINQPPFDGLFENGLFDFKHCVDATTLLFGTQVALKVLKDKFGWTGLDNQAINSKPIIWNILAPSTPSNITYPSYSLVDQEFYYLTDGTEPEKLSHIDAVTHELVHGIIDAKLGKGNSFDLDPCSERKVLAEALADIIGLYALNEYEQNSPAFYKWNISKGFLFPGRSFDNPNAIGQPDTYYGNFYASFCPESGNYPEHKNATVIDHWYYLLANGTIGTETNDLGYSYKLNGIGINKAIQIVWKCLDYVGKYTDFNDLKKASLTIAEQLYGLHSTEYLAVMDAWCAVGICDNNLGVFSMSPAHGTVGVQPWPGVNVNVTWEGNGVKEWEVQMSTSFDFSENLQSVLVKNFTTVIKPGGGTAHAGFATGYYHPGERVYARARITQADADFCKGYNPLCVLYQQFGPAHAFTLEDKQATFWHAVPGNTWYVNAWNNPSVDWKSVSGAHRYTLQVATDDAFSKMIYNDEVPVSGNFLETGLINASLETNKTYYTRVRAERLNSPNITDNFGAWSAVETIYANVPQTSIIQAVGQKANDPASLVSSLGFWVGWDPYPGTSHYVVQVATDNAFGNIIRSETAAGNLNSIEVLLPPVSDQTELFVRVLPQKGAAFGTCSNIWRIKTDQNAILPAMKGPPDGSVIPYKAFGVAFEWKGGSLNLNWVDHFEFHLTDNSSNLKSIFTTQGKVFDIYLQDPFIFDDKQGFDVQVLAVNPLGAKTGLCQLFHYNICPDHPGVSFPGDLGKVDPFKDFDIEWYPSFWFDAGSQYLVAIKDQGNPVSGFNDKLTTANSMLVPAGTLTNEKNYTLTVKNSSSCAGILLPEIFFTASGVGGMNQPQPPKLVDFNIEVQAFRNDPDGSVFPPAWGTSNYVLGIELFEPDGTQLGLVDANFLPVTELQVDSENSGVIMVGSDKPEGKYKLRLKVKNIFDPLVYYPFDQPRFSVKLNGQPVITDHVITVDFFDAASIFNEWKIGFQYPDIVLDIK